MWKKKKKEGGKGVFADVIKDLEMRRLFWIIQMGPKCGGGRFYTQKRRQCENSTERFEDTGLEDAVTNQRVPGTTRS